MIDWNAEVQTTAGDKVVIVTTDGPREDYPIVGYVVHGLNWITYDWTREGMSLKSGYKVPNDLVNVHG